MCIAILCLLYYAVLTVFILTVHRMCVIHVTVALCATGADQWLARPTLLSTVMTVWPFPLRKARERVTFN